MSISFQSRFLRKQSITMPDAAQINRSISTIKTELEYLVSSGVLAAPQLQSIQAQLPVRLHYSHQVIQQHVTFFHVSWFGSRTEEHGLLTRGDDSTATERPAVTVYRYEVCRRRKPIQPRARRATSAGPGASGESESSKGTSFIHSLLSCSIPLGGEMACGRQKKREEGGRIV